jgi:hypothetical protein
MNICLAFIRVIICSRELSDPSFHHLVTDVFEQFFVLIDDGKVEGGFFSLKVDLSLSRLCLFFGLLVQLAVLKLKPLFQMKSVPASSFPKESSNSPP